MANRKEIIFCAIITAIVVTVSTMDYSDARQADREYCSNVRAHVWPDYNGNFKQICRKPS